MIYEMVDMLEWRTKEDLLQELKEKGVDMSERTFRKVVENVNKLFYNHEINTFIAHSGLVYKATKEDEEIKKSALDYKKRALNQLTKYSRICKALGENLNMKIELDDERLLVAEDGGLRL